MVRYVRCINILREIPDITVGKVYKLVRYHQESYDVINNFGKLDNNYKMELFEVLNPLETQLYLAKERLHDQK